MKIASRKTMIEKFGLENINILENGEYDFTQDQGSINLVKFVTRMDIATKSGADEITLLAFVNQCAHDVDACELDNLNWSTPDYYAYI